MQPKTTSCGRFENCCCGEKEEHHHEQEEAEHAVHARVGAENPAPDADSAKTETAGL